MKQPTFCVIYRWRLDENRIDEFRTGWAQVTQHYLDNADSLGSRLHKCDDGTWTAYAQWPDRATWKAAGDLKTQLDGYQQMADAVIERFEPIFLNTDTDMLAHDCNQRSLK